MSSVAADNYAHVGHESLSHKNSCLFLFPCLKVKTFFQISQKRALHALDAEHVHLGPAAAKLIGDLPILESFNLKEKHFQMRSLGLQIANHPFLLLGGVSVEHKLY